MGNNYMIVYLKTDYGFIEMPYGIRSLQKGDEFKMINPQTNEVFVGSNNKTVFKCASDPYWNDNLGEWEVKIEEEV